MEHSEAPIDIFALPIPNWNLECPKCHYCLNGLMEHRCPECGEAFDMSQVVRPWHKLREPRFRGDELPLPDFLMECAACGESLAGATRPECPKCLAPFDLASMRPRDEWFIVEPGSFGALPMPLIRAMLVEEGIPFVEDDSRSAFEMLAGTYRLAGRLAVSSEFFFEFRVWVARLISRLRDDHRQWSGRTWTCACGEPVPGQFEVCWKCGEDRPIAIS